MSDSLSFTVPGEPVPKARAVIPRRGKPYTPERTRLAEQAVGWYAIQAGVILPPSHLGKYDYYPLFGLRVTAYCKSKRAIRSDGSNFLKLVEDALNRIAWADDWQVFDTRCIKVPVKDNPRTEIEFWRME